MRKKVNTLYGDKNLSRHFGFPTLGRRLARSPRAPDSLLLPRYVSAQCSVLLGLDFVYWSDQEGLGRDGKIKRVASLPEFHS
jgi:hypothetical protein